MVIHGGIDGYSRLIVFLRAAANNRSATVLDSFVAAVTQYGVPSRVRTDRGGENSAVCLLMNIFRGFRRGSAIQGRSVHNQRIERLWADLWRGVTHVYRELFHFLEGEGIIDPDKEMHLWALHYIYLPRINRDLADFISQWNNHGLRTERHLSPRQLFVRGCLQQQGRPLTAVQDIFATPSATPPPAAAPLPPATEVAPHVAAASLPTPDVPGDVAGLLDWGEGVIVPEIDYPIEGEVMEQIRAQFDPLSGLRGQHGIHLICGLISFLESLTPE